MKAIPLGFVAVLLTAGAATAQTFSEASFSETSFDIGGPPAITEIHTYVITPVKGANSFTQSQARHRLQDYGFSDVTSLSKDPDGVWRGVGRYNGRPANVWVDYQGNVGHE